MKNNSLIWRSGTPNPKDEAHCAAIKNGEFYDAVCDNKARVVCQLYGEPTCRSNCEYGRLSW